MRDFLELVARPEGVYLPFVSSDLDSLTERGAPRKSAPAPTLRANPEGRVYFVRAGRMRAVKIGFARDPEARLRELQTASHHRLHLLGHIAGAVEDEAEWHRRFVADRMRGEWFALTPTLRAAINQALSRTEGAVPFIRLSEMPQRFAVAQIAAHSVHGGFYG